MPSDGIEKITNIVIVGIFAIAFALVLWKC